MSNRITAIQQLWTGPWQSPSQKARFQKVADWALERGFTLNCRGRLRHTYVVYWTDGDRVRHSESVATLADVEPFVLARIAANEARQPGVWYLHWYIDEIEEYEKESWCRWRRWVRVQAVEGLSYRPLAQSDPSIGGDPTPYDSVETVLTLTGLLGLELNARVSLSAMVIYLSGRSVWEPTLEYTDEAATELVLDCIQHSAPEASASAGEIAYRVHHAAALDPAKGERVVERLLQEGRLCWSSYVNEHGRKHPVIAIAPSEHAYLKGKN